MHIFNIKGNFQSFLTEKYNVHFSFTQERKKIELEIF